MKWAIRIPALVVIATSVVVWAYGVHRYPQRVDGPDAWFAVLLFIVPQLLVLLGLWIVVDHRWWRWALGVLLLVPALAIWVVSLMFVNAGFRIH